MTPHSAIELRDAIVAGRAGAAQTLADTFARIERGDDTLHAFQSLMRERAEARAAAIDANPAAFRDRPLAGVPIAIKDNIATRGHVTTAGSRVLETFAPPYDAHVVSRLDAAGAIIVGKTSLDEFAMGSSTEHSAFGPSRNPWAPDRIPGGSSGGSAVAVAAGFTPISLGSDTGGSIRQPAALCGVVGLKPTYGRVSRFGLFAFASSLDQIGPFARRVRDAARLLDVIAGRDERDSTSADVPPVTWDGEPMRKGLRIGVPRREIGAGVDPEVSAAFARALEELVRGGATLHDIELPSSSAAVSTYYLLVTAEASSNLARYDGVRYGSRRPAGSLDEMYARTRTAGFGDEVKRRIMLGTFALSAGYYEAYYLKAQKVRTLIRREFDAAFHSVDVIAMPTTPTPAFRLGERLDDPIQMYLADVFTVGASLAGLPAISVPCGFSTARLPLGLQLIGRPWEECVVFGAAEAYERATTWWRETPAPV